MHVHADATAAAPCTRVQGADVRASALDEVSRERTITMNWLYLGIAVIFEIAVGISAGKAQGFSRLRWTVATLLSGAIATFFLSLALLTFDVGAGYALWTSLAGVGLVIVGALFFAQRLTWKKFLGIVIVIAGVVGLNLVGTA
jgi:quaternary ammonium compound-resistance protein SugE